MIARTRLDDSRKTPTLDHLFMGQTQPDSVTRVTSERITFPLFLIYTFWVLHIFEPGWFLAGTIGGPFYKFPTILLPVLVIVSINYCQRRSLYWPLIVFVLLHLGASVFAENAGLSRLHFKFLVYMLLQFIGSVSLIDSPYKAITVLKVFLLGFIWYGIQGLPDGRVSWHTMLGNEDSYGPLMVMGLGFSYYFAMGIRSWWWRRLGYAVCLLCVIGTVVSLARGAVLSAGLVLFLVWLRSPRKLGTFMGGFAALLVFLLALKFILPSGVFFDEMQTISEGNKAGTGQARWFLWQFAWEVFLDNPLFGVGVGNFGVIASKTISSDFTRPQFHDAHKLYGAGLHNIYFQILSEEGIIGVWVWTTMLVGFVRRIRFLRSQSADNQWNRHGGEGIDIRAISLGLESAMIAFLATGFFYNQLYVHWFWTLITITFVLSELTSGSPATANTGLLRRGASSEIENETRFAMNGNVRHL